MTGMIKGKINSAVSWTGSYLLDNGDGLEEHSDTFHSSFLFKNTISASPVNSILEDLDCCRCLCIATGDTEFGEFVSKGIFQQEESNKVTGVRRTLTLARRYLPTKGDVRKKLTVPELISLTDLLGDSEPWFNLPVKLSKKDHLQMLAKDRIKSDVIVSAKCSSADMKEEDGVKKRKLLCSS